MRRNRDEDLKRQQKLLQEYEARRKTWVRSLADEQVDPLQRFACILRPRNAQP